MWHKWWSAPVHVRALSAAAMVSRTAMTIAIAGYPPTRLANRGPDTGASAVTAVIGALNKALMAQKFWVPHRSEAAVAWRRVWHPRAARVPTGREISTKGGPGAEDQQGAGVGWGGTGKCGVGEAAGAVAC